MISPAAALAYLGWRMWAGYDALAGKHSSPAAIELVPARFDEHPRFTRACADLSTLGFAPIGDFEVAVRMGSNTRQKTFLRAFLSAERSAFAVVYELLSLTAIQQARAAAQKIWMEMVSRLSDRQSLTTSTVEPPLELLDEDPDRPVRRFPGASASELWERHCEAAGMSLTELSAEEFVRRFTEGWTRGFEFQASRGLYVRQGDRFVATGKIALRSVLDFHLGLRRRTGPAYAAGVFVAVLAGSVATAVAAHLPQQNAVPMTAGFTGAAFAAAFRHFELPGALMVCAMALVLGHDEPFAILSFLAVLLALASSLQHARASRAAARLAA